MKKKWLAGGIATNDLFGSAYAARNGTSTYEPISSVWERSDGELLEAMLSFYSTINPEPILDATYNAGRFWKDSARQVWSMDIDPRHKPMILADNRVMNGVPSAKFGFQIQTTGRHAIPTVPTPGTGVSFLLSLTQQSDSSISG